MAKLKCYLCGKVFDEKDLIYTKDPDELMCPMCGAREPGFEEVHCPTGKETKIEWETDNE